MNRLITIFLLLTILAGCGNSDKAKKDDREEKIWAQMYKNMDIENVSLLSIKYGIDEQLLKNIISEYETMVFGYSLTDVDAPIPENIPDIVSVSVAIEKLSAKYTTSKQVLSQILIELIMMEKDNE